MIDIEIEGMEHDTTLCIGDGDRDGMRRGRVMLGDF